ncbi:hypothetical protein [Conchiformibius steedae]|uniref:Uncharacterized protein n=1 Tax=Conchiformibius steedae TaxID=153493 RepID=A0A3P2A614_9NEIS|nr:hypothetical protein [Conchiformibius steedae]RRD90348.1 hypothetical protein EII21_05355 [Conchiformibius steedae]
MITPIYDVSLPSNVKSLLHSLIGRKLIKMLRCNNDSIEYLIKTFELEPRDFFSLCLGPILLYFEDGLIFGGSSDPSRNSVLVWVEKNEIGQTTQWLQEEDKNLIPFDAKDFTHWSVFLNQKIKSVSILKEIEKENLKKMELANERGVLLNFENGLSLIISHGLNDNSDSTTIISLEEINSYFKGKLNYIDIL